MSALRFLGLELTLGIARKSIGPVLKTDRERLPGSGLRGFPPNAVMGVLDSWGWELEPGLGKGSIIKGLIRIKKGQACEDLLNASGRFSNGIRFFLEPLKWEETTLKKQPFISWVEQTPGESDFVYAGRV